ncbi:MAG TPA: UPF0182 family protein, partial [Acidimicrobiales bacterium]|nr:UPF0182 family protein [Acidimicrobiales bacterium]
MRAPGDVAPRPPRRVPGTNRSRVWLAVLGVALFVLLTSLRGIAGFYTDYLWFDSLDFPGVFTGVLSVKVGLAVVFSLLFFAVLWVNLFIADRLAPRFRPPGPEEDVVERYHEIVGERAGLVRTVLSALFALIAGAGVSSRWNDWILFTNARDFGLDDPLFSTDAGFYVFQLPFLTFLVDWGFASLVIITIVTAVAHYLNGGIRFQGAAQRVTTQVKAHLSVLLGLLALLRAVSYWLQRFELTLSTRGTVDGATYTDVNAQLPALNLLILISLAAFVLFIININRRGWILPALAVGTWALAAVVVGGLYPAFVQRFQVVPAESARERTFIARNIEATRFALGLDEVETTPFANAGDLDGEALQDNAETVRNIRVWDPQLLLQTFQQLQEVRPQYQIVDVDVDRYELDGELTQIEISARELDTPGVPQDSWEARHLTYTHGYGAVAAPANSKTTGGRPELVVSDIPVTGTENLNLDEEPGIYVGEGLSGYVMVNTAREEIDFQNNEGTQFTTYDGADGVGVGSYLRRAAFALRFNDINPLISSSVQGDSRILYQRDIRERVQELAPFLSFDADPYAVTVDGELKYVIDAYTTSSSFPYAQRADTGQLPQGSGLNRDFNYVRNSVKAVIDAYDGTVTFYVVDPDDPIAQAYKEAFPNLFTDGTRVPEEIEAHFRYPEDLFRTQTNMWGRYHIEDADDFYNNNDGWNVAQDPGAGTSAQVTQALDPVTGVPVGPAQEARIDPYYLLMRLPDDDELSFVMLRPFVPVSGDDRQRLMTAFMVAKSDPGSYGELQTFTMPRNNLPEGPAIVGANMQQDQEVSELQTLLSGEGSRVVYGNLVIVPVDQSLLYVRPFYVISDTTQIPELRKVIVSYGDRVVVEDTLELSLIELFGDAPETREEEGPGPDGEPAPPDGGEEPPDEDGGETPPAAPPAGNDDVPGLLAQAQAAFDQAEAALAEGDLGGYQRQVEAGRALVARAREAADPEAAAPPTTEAPAPSPP